MSNISVINIDNSTRTRVSLKKKVQHRLKVASYDPSVPYEPMCGDNVTNAIRHTIALANHFGTTYTLKFNNNLVPIEPNSNSNEVYADWERICAEASAAWKNSPEGQAYYREQEIRRLQYRQDAREVMSKFDNVDWSDLDQVLDFLNQTVQPLGTVYTEDLNYGEKINQKLIESGYVVSANCGDAFDENDKDNFGRYLVGQAMSGFSYVGCIHDIYSKFYNDYLEKFSA